jgi:hypothetical protein
MREFWRVSNLRVRTRCTRTDIKERERERERERAIETFMARVRVDWLTSLHHINQ